MMIRRDNIRAAGPLLSTHTRPNILLGLTDSAQAQVFGADGGRNLSEPYSFRGFRIRKTSPNRKTVQLSLSELFGRCWSERLSACLGRSVQFSGKTIAR